MHFDDRLATVLRHSASGDRAMRTQYRQLLDLMGGRGGRDASLAEAGYLRIAALDEAIPAAERALMLRDPGLRLRNPELLLRLAETEPEVAASALAKAELSADQWDALVPELPIRARGFLRLRRDLPDSTMAILDRLGVHDRGLPRPENAASDSTANLPVEPYPDNVAPLRPANDIASRVENTEEDESEISALVKRIEAFQKARTASAAPAGEHAADAPPLPFEEHLDTHSVRIPAFAFSCDAEGRIDWAEPSVGPMIVGTSLRDPLAGMPQELTRAFRHRLPLSGIGLTLEAAPALAGEWIVDASPRFTNPGGRFYGYAGKFRRPPVQPAEQPSAAMREADSVRQLLHELRTPVNAIQGFAEVIQQQLFGPAPHEYRALAASIAGDAARILAGFDEMDRLAKLEGNALELDGGETDLAPVIHTLLAQLQPVLKPRTAAIEARIEPEPTTVPLSNREAEALGWRLLATLASTVGAGETLDLSLEVSGNEVVLLCELPASLAAETDVFATNERSSASSVSAGMFGAGFALRLARAEARAAGGDMLRVKDSLYLTLPYLTGRGASHTQEPAAPQAASSS